MKFKGGVVFIASVALVALSAAPSQAASTRAEWVAQVDPICQAGLAQEAAADAPLITALRRAKKRGSLNKPSKKLDHAFARFYDQIAVIEHGVNAQIAAVPPALPDQSLIQVWLRIRGQYVDSIDQGFHALVHNNGKLALKLIFQSISLGQEASDLVSDFGFHYCSVATSGGGGAGIFSAQAS